MFDAKLLPLQRRLIHPLAGRLHARGVKADTITLAGFWWQPLNDIAFAVCEKGILNNAKFANAKHKNTQSVHSN